MAKKRANGEGNIRKRKDGRWEGRFTVSHDPITGKPIARSGQNPGGSQGKIEESTGGSWAGGLYQKGKIHSGNMDG